MTKLDARGSSVLYSTYIGGSGIDEARGMTIDTLGNVYVVGSTTSTNFPTVSPRQAALAGESDGFLLRVSTTGGGITFSTYFGGVGIDEVNAVAVDAGGNMYVAGTTRSVDLPLLNPAQAYQGQLDGFVSKFSPAGTLVYSTYHGGTGVDTLEGIGVDAAGNVNTTGSTRSTNLPVLNAWRPASGGSVDAFFSRFSADRFTAVLLLLRGQRQRRGPSRRRLTRRAPPSSAGAPTSPDFPVAAALQPAFGGEMDAFLLARVARPALSPAPPTMAARAASAAGRWP